MVSAEVEGSHSPPYSKMGEIAQRKGERLRYQEDEDQMG